MLPFCGENSTFVATSQVKKFIAEQSSFLKYPAGAVCWMQVGEEPGNDKYL